ncbi:zinc finger, CCHC-type containing protein [Tanacetum coccineum]
MWGMSLNEGFTPLFILEINLGGKGDLEAKLRPMYQLEGDVGRLHDDFPWLETSLRVVVCSCGAAGRKRDKEGMWSFWGSKPFNTLADLGSCVNIIPLYLFKNLNIGLLEELTIYLDWSDGTKSYPVGIVKDVEVHIRKLKLLNDFYVIDMKKDPETPLLVERGFLATTNAVIDCRMAKIAVGEGITRSVFGVKGVNLGEEEALY